jgi:hypothetical protein
MSEVSTVHANNPTVLTLTVDNPEFEIDIHSVRSLSVLTLTLDTPVPESRPSVWDYNTLINKPAIEGVELLGNLTLADFGIPDLTNVPTEPLSNSDLDEIIDAVDRSLDSPDERQP